MLPSIALLISTTAVDLENLTSTSLPIAAESSIKSDMSLSKASTTSSDCLTSIVASNINVLDIALAKPSFLVPFKPDLAPVIGFTAG